MDKTEIEELAAAYALGALDTADRAAVEARLAAGDSLLQEAISDFGETASQLLFEASPQAPRSGFKERLMGQFTEEKEVQQQPAANPFFFLRATEGVWEEMSPGISKKILFKDQSRKTMLLRMGPNTIFPGHSHDGPEELYVLEGSCICAGEPLGPGDYHRAEAHSDHIPTTTESGCLMLIISPGIALHG